jgi:hypothetical protein
MLLRLNADGLENGTGNGKFMHGLPRTPFIRSRSVMVEKRFHTEGTAIRSSRAQGDRSLFSVVSMFMEAINFTDKILLELCVKRL